MTTHDLTEDDFYTEQAMLIDEHRIKLTSALNRALAALHDASISLAELTSNHVYDAEFADTHNGGDVAALIDDSQRFTRAACAITHIITERG